MRIHSIDVTHLSFPLTRPITTNLHTLDAMEGIYLTIHTHDGLKGHGFIYGLGAINCRDVISKLKNVFSPLLIEKELFHTLEDWKVFWKNYTGNESISLIYALAAVDMALWDIFAKEKSMPLHKVLGGGVCSQKVPVYATTGWFSLTSDELVAECQKYALLGVNAFKIRLGHKQDYERAKLLREIMGENFLLMVDANQRYNVPDAIQVARLLEKFQITWFEEPVSNFVSDLVEVGTNTSIPLAVGENMLELHEFVEVCESRAANFLQPDVGKCGGITGFTEVTQVAKRYNVLLCSHLLPEISVSLIGSCQNGYMLEYSDFIPKDAFTQDFSIHKGCVQLPGSLGTGVELTKSALKNFTIN